MGFREGRLGIEQGRVESGSVLLVEEWSRFSRDNPYDGAPVSRQIFDAGVGIVDLRTNTLYNAERLRTDMGLRIRLDVEWERSFRESEEKSTHKKSSWANEQEKARLWAETQGKEGAPMTRIRPEWLEPVLSKPDANGKQSLIGYKAIPKRAKTVRRIFDMRIQGIGPGRIVKLLNADPSAWHPEPHAKNRRGGWRSSYVIKILKNPAVIGIFSSPKLVEPIENYYPAILLDRDRWNRVQAIRARNAEIAGHERQEKIQDELDQIRREIDEYLESIGRSSGARKRALESHLDKKLARQKELKKEQKKELKSARTRPDRIERVVDQAVSVKSLIEHMKQLPEGAERNALRRRLKTHLHQLLKKIEIEPGAHQSKIVMHYLNGFTLHLTVDPQANPTLYHFDGGMVDVDADSSKTVAIERAERQSRVNRLVAKALRKHGLSDNMAL